MRDFATTFLSKSRITRVKPSHRTFRRELAKVYTANNTLPITVSQNSAQVFTVAPEVVKKKDYQVLWIGDAYADLLSQCNGYGISCCKLDALDFSSIYHAKCLVFAGVDITAKNLSVINFACEYGIPSVWLHKSLPPDVCYWNFTRFVHINDSNLFWRDICQLLG